MYIIGLPVPAAEWELWTIKNPPIEPNRRIKLIKRLNQPEPVEDNGTYFSLTSDQAHTTRPTTHRSQSSRKSSCRLYTSGGLLTVLSE